MRRLTENNPIDLLKAVIESYVQKYPLHAFKIEVGGNFFTVGRSRAVINISIEKEEILSKIFSEGSWAIGEAYSTGTIETDEKDYKFFLLIFIRLITDKRIVRNLNPFFKKRIQKMPLYKSFFKTRAKKTNKDTPFHRWFQTKEQENTFYFLWLKTPYTQYSSGKWNKNTKTLAQAQINKINFYAKLLGIHKGSSKKLLELGCGWGGFVLYIAKKYGLRCVGIDISRQRINFIEKEKKRLGLENHVFVNTDDMRYIKDTFDYIVSIGTQLSPNRYDMFFKKISNHLNRGGRALFHYSLFESNFIYKDDPFLQKYIFPDGGYRFKKEYYLLLKKYFHSVTVGFLPNLSYVKTLDAWLNNFVCNEKKIEKLFNTKIKKDDVRYYIRVFKHYLAFTSASFMVTGKTIYILAKKADCE